MSRILFANKRMFGATNRSGRGPRPSGFSQLVLIALSAVTFATAGRSEPTGSVVTKPGVSPLLLGLGRDRLVEIFSPDRTTHASLSPDGRYLAYSLREGSALAVVVVPVDQPDKATARVEVANDATSTPTLAPDAAEKTPAAIRWMGWVTPRRLVVETNRSFSAVEAGSWVNGTGAIMAFDADGGNARTLVTPKETSYEGLDFDAFAKSEASVFERVKSVDQPLADPAVPSSDPATEFALPPAIQAGSIRLLRSPRIHDFAAGEPNSVLVRTEGDRHVGIYKLNVVTGRLTSVNEDVLDLAKVPLFDRQGKARGAVPAHTRVSFPHSYDVDTGTGLLRWKPLDQIAGITAGAPGFHVAPESFFSERAVPIGFDENPELLYFAANLGRDTFGIYGLNLKNGQRTRSAFENPRLDLVEPAPGRFIIGQPLVFDRYTRALVGIRFETWWRTARWLRPSLQAVQTKLEQTLPGRSIDLLEWDQAEQRFLVLTRGPVDPGTYYVFDAAKAKLAEFVRRVPISDPKEASQAAVFNFKDTAGREMGALLQLPGASRPKPTALVVLCPREPWSRARSDHQPEVQALTAMGLAVLQVNGRGATGFGIKHREALKAGYEEAQIEDLVSALDYLQKYLPMNLKRVVAMGADWGGFVALRAVQLHPERFRCAVTLNATVDPGDWLANSTWAEGAPGPALTRAYYGDAARLKSAPLMRQAATISRPVLLLNYPGVAGSPLPPKYLVAKRFAAAVRAGGGVAEFSDLSEDFARGYPLAKAETYGRIQQFLNASLFSFEVNVGETKVVTP